MHAIVSVARRLQFIPYRTYSCPGSVYSRSILGPWPTRLVIHECVATFWQSRQHATKVELRPYQEESIQAILDHLSKGEKRLGLSLATGSGKTVIFSHLIDRVPAPTQGATRCLIIAHRQELVEQAARVCRLLYPDKIVEIEMGKHDASGIADITIASVATLGRSPARLRKFDPSRFKLLLVDEAHHIVAGTYLKVLEHFKLGKDDEAGPTALVGVSATFSRLDGLALGKAVDHIVYHKDYVEMISDGWLASATFTTVRTGADLSKVATRAGDFQASALSKAVNTDENNDLTVRIWFEKAAERRSTLIFCVDIAHVTKLTATFRRYGIDARFVTAASSSAERVNVLEAFKERRFPVLLNCGIYTEGTDIPNVDCIVLARPTKSRTLLVQMIGRGLRLFHDKDNCHIIDLVASLQRGIVTTPTLFGLDPDALVESQTITQMNTLRERQEANDLQAKKIIDQAGLAPNSSGDVIFTDYDNIDDYLKHTNQNSHIRQESRYAWVGIDNDKYILNNKDGSYLIINQTPQTNDATTFGVRYLRRLPSGLSSKSPFATPKHLGNMHDLQTAVHAADHFASKTFLRGFIDRSAFWRKGFATQGQLDFLNKLRGHRESPLLPGSITSGAAADWITRLRHGARGKLNRMEAHRDRAAKAVKKEEQWREKQQRSEVRVGPVGQQTLDSGSANYTQ